MRINSMREAYIAGYEKARLTYGQKKGFWKEIDNGDTIITVCSQCGISVNNKIRRCIELMYCPNCGAKMSRTVSYYKHTKNIDRCFTAQVVLK